MFVTVLPVSSYSYYCSPPSNSTSFLEIARRALRLLSGFGLSINGEQVFCGDYIYSGHTVILVTAYLFIKECKFLSSNEWVIVCFEWDQGCYKELSRKIRIQSFII